MVHPSHWQDTDTINLIHYYSSDGSSLSLTRYHQPQSLLFIRWFSPLTDQITSVWVIISHQMVLPWPDTICLSHYYSSHSSALFLTRYHQPQFLLFIRWFIPLTDQIASASVIIFHTWLSPPTDNIPSASVIFFHTWFSPITEQIQSVSFIIIHHMVQPSSWPDTINLSYYINYMVQLPNWPDTINLRFYC